MAVTAIAGSGTILKVTLSSTLTAIPGVTRLTPPSWSQGKIDVTDLDATWMGCVAEIPDPKPITGELIFNPSNATLQALDAIADTQTAVACEVIPPAGGKKFQFNAYISEWNTSEVSPKGIHKKTFSLQPTGAITRAASS